MEVRFRRAGLHDDTLTRSVVVDAFGAEGEETAVFLDALRADGCIVGEWLAEDPSGVIAHIAFSRVWLEDEDGKRQPAAMLTPLSVRLDRQRVGIGTRLMEHALSELEKLGETTFFVIGHPDYYPRAGFHATRAADVESPWRGEPWFMVRAVANLKGRLLMPRVIADAH